MRRRRSRAPLPATRKRAAQPRPVSRPKPPPKAPAAPARKSSRKRILMGAAAIVVLIGGAWFGYDYATVGRFLVSTDDAYVRANNTTLGAKVCRLHRRASRRGEHQGPCRRSHRPHRRRRLSPRRRPGPRQGRDPVGDHLPVRPPDRGAALSRRAGAGAARLGPGGANADAARIRAPAVARGQAIRQPADARTVDRQPRPGQCVGHEREGRARQRHRQYRRARGAEAGSRDHARRAARPHSPRPSATCRSPRFARRSTASSATAPPRSATTCRPASASPRWCRSPTSSSTRTSRRPSLPGSSPASRSRSRSTRCRATNSTAWSSSFSPASGSVFTLLPPDNATGNFTKIIQRLPVRIRVPADVAERGALRPGMSVVATVNTKPGAIVAAGLAPSTASCEETRREGGGHGHARRRHQAGAHRSPPRRRLHGDVLRDVHGAARHPDRLGLARTRSRPASPPRPTKFPGSRPPISSPKSSRSRSPASCRARSARARCSRCRAPGSPSRASCAGSAPRSAP